MSKKSGFLRKGISIAGLVDVLLFVICVFTVTGFLGKFGWLLDLTSNFRVQYAVIQLLCVVFLLITKRCKLAVVALLFASVNIVQIVPWYVHKSHSPDVDKAIFGKVRILLINVGGYRTEYDKTIQYIKEVNPDVLALEEINERWMSALSDVLSGLAFKRLLTREDNFGIGLFGNIALEDPVIEYFGSAKLPSIVSKIYIGRQPVTVLFTHPVPPGNAGCFHLRNEQLEEIASSRKNFGDCLIVIGDLNTTSWSYYYKRFVSKMELYDSRQGFGIQPSWPTTSFIKSIPIDHCLVSHDIIVLDRKIGPNIGSDHYPVYIELGLLN